MRAPTSVKGRPLFRRSSFLLPTPSVLKVEVLPSTLCQGFLSKKPARGTKCRNSFYKESIMRSRLILLLILFILLTLGFAISRLIAFVQLFFEHSGISITQQEIASAYTKSGAQRRPQLIPKIIHQVFHDWRHQNQSLPSDWDDLRQTCISLNKDWEYIVCRNLLSIISRFS